MKLFKVSATFTRTANTTTYGTEELVANSETAGSVVPMSFAINGGFKVWYIDFEKDGTTVANSDFDLNFWATATAVVTSAGDNAAWTKANVPIDGYIGNVVLPVMTAGSDASNVVDDNLTDGLTEPAIFSGFVDAQAKLYCLVNTTSAYVPDSAEVFKLTLVYEKL